MNKKKLKKCYKCHKSDLLLTKSGKTNAGKQRFCCRECNTRALKSYRLTPRGREKINNAVYKSIKKHPNRQKARSLVRLAIKNGNLVKPLKCKCGNRVIEAHHENYSKPLNVKWLCRKCHSDLHLTMCYN